METNMDNHYIDTSNQKRKPKMILFHYLKAKVLWFLKLKVDSKFRWPPKLNLGLLNN